MLPATEWCWRLVGCGLDFREGLWKLSIDGFRCKPPRLDSGGLIRSSFND